MYILRTRTDLYRVSGGVVRSLLHGNNYRTGSVALRHARLMLQLGTCIEEADKTNGVQRARERKKERKEKERL